MSINKNLAVGICALPLTLGIAGCGPSTEMPQSGQIGAETISSITPTTTIELGNAAYIRTVDPNSAEGKRIKDGTPYFDSIYPAELNKIESDPTTPILQTDPVRLHVEATLTGRNPSLENDGVCDVAVVPEGAKSIGAIALGNTPDSTSISWLKNSNGEPSNHAYICSIQNLEPEDGVVVWVTI